jgi:hypothetical protein
METFTNPPERWTFRLNKLSEIVRGLAGIARRDFSRWDDRRTRHAHHSIADTCAARQGRHGSERRSRDRVSRRYKDGTAIQIARGGLLSPAAAQCGTPARALF